MHLYSYIYNDFIHYVRQYSALALNGLPETVLIIAYRFTF